MKKNYFLGCIISTLVICFCFSCKHATTSETLATPEQLQSDCIRYAGLNTKAGLLEESKGILYWDMDRVTQFEEGETDVKSAYNYLINGTGTTFYLDKVRYQMSINDSVRIPLEGKCKQLLKENPSEKGIVAVFVKGEKEPAKTICTFDIWDCKSNDFVRTYVNKKTEFTIGDFIVKSCQAKMKYETAKYQSNITYILHFDRSAEMCIADPLYKSFNKLGISSKDIGIYIGNVSDTRYDISSTTDLLNWKVSGAFNQVVFREVTSN